jgi:hypothetical protein
MVNLVQLIGTAAARQIKANFVRKTRQTSAVQEQFLLALLSTYQNTEFGKNYGLSQIKTVDQFRERIPILPYSSYEPYLDRIAEGETNILTPDPVVYLSLTSGTTSKKKLIPVTKRSRSVRGRANRTSISFAVDAARQWGRPLGQMLLTSSVQLAGRTSAGIEYGPVSVGELRSADFLSRQLIAYPYEILQIADSLAHHYVCLLFALQNPNTRVIGANFPVLALRLCDYLERYAENLIEDLAKGTIAPWLDLESELRIKLERSWKAAPQRADELRQILKAEGCLTPKLAWSDLSFVVTARGGTSDFYFERFPHYFGDTPIFGGIYGSTEAVFGVYYDFNNDGAILAIESGFFEFIPQDQWDASQPKTLLAQEVKVGEMYRILVTNYNGLYRYDLGDVVEVLGYYEKAPIIVFRHRVGGLLSSTTEKTTEFHVTQVMQVLQRNFNLSLENFCVTLSEQETPPHYLVNIELSPGHILGDPQAFLAEFDRELKEIHTSYETKRLDGQVPQPRLRVLQKGSFATLRQRLLQRGIPEFHLKFPHISEDRQVLAGLTVEQEVRLAED